jgi:4-amino-4-deoxy-L-arabinose transferase-like glycosyltransferase
MIVSPQPDSGAAARGDWLFRGVLVTACLVLFVAATSSQSVMDRDEARFALAVKEMSERGDWLVPSNFGEPRYNKPILCYWLALGSTRILGMNEAALRLPSALCGVLTVLMTMAIATRMRGRRVARIAGVVTATAFYLVLEARSLTADASLLAATTLSFWAWSRLREPPSDPGRWRLLLWLGVGLGLMAKGVNVAFLGAAACALALLEGSENRRFVRLLAVAIAVGAVATAIPGAGVVGPVILLAIAVVFLARSLASPDGRHGWLRVGAAWGIPLTLAMFLAWGIPAALVTHGGFISEGVGHHLLGRTVRPYEGHSGWPGYYVVATIVAFFPWGSLLPAAIHEGWRQRADPAVAYLLAWVLGPLVLVELTTSKLPHYMLVTFPALAILVALLIEARISGAREWTRAERITEAAVFAVICLATGSAGLYVAGRFDGLPVRLMAGSLSVAALAAAATCAFVVATRRPAQLVALLAASAAALYLLAFVALLPALEPQRLAPVLGAAVARRLEPDQRLVLCKVGEASVGYYMPRPPDVVGGPDAVKAALQSDPRDALVLVPDDDRGLLASLQAGDRARWETLETVHGVILPNPSPRRILVVRRRGTGSGSVAGIDPLQTTTLSRQRQPHLVAGRVVVPQLGAHAGQQRTVRVVAGQFPDHHASQAAAVGVVGLPRR